MQNAANAAWVKLVTCLTSYLRHAIGRELELFTDRPLQKTNFTLTYYEDKLLFEVNGATAHIPVHSAKTAVSSNTLICALETFLKSTDCSKLWETLPPNVPFMHKIVYDTALGQVMINANRANLHRDVVLLGFNQLNF